MRLDLAGVTALTRRTAIILTLVTLVFFAFIAWFGERQSCLRQQLPRQAGNARKAAIDALVRAESPTMSSAARAEVLRLTRAVPRVPLLQCNRLLPATE